MFVRKSNVVAFKFFGGAYSRSVHWHFAVSEGGGKGDGFFFTSILQRILKSALPLHKTVWDIWRTGGRVVVVVSGDGIVRRILIVSTRAKSANSSTLVETVSDAVFYYWSYIFEYIYIIHSKENYLRENCQTNTEMIENEWIKWEANLVCLLN